MTSALRRAAPWLYVVVAMAALAFPVANIGQRLLREPPLAGAQEEPALPRPTWASIRSGHFQDRLEAWFNFHLGLRPGLVRLDSTLSWYAFHQTSAVSRAIRGRGDALFIDEDVAFLNRERPVPSAAYASRLGALARLQRTLAARGQALVPVIIPSKTSLHPDEVPASLRASRADPRPSDESYHALRTALDAAGVRYADGRAALERLRAEGMRAFPLTGRHLSRPGACRVAGEIASVAADLLRAPIAPPDCTAVGEVPADFQAEEFDLRRLANLFEYPPHTRSVRVASTPEVPPAARAPAPGPVLFVCSSFCYKLQEAWQRAALGSATRYWYYHSQLYRSDGRPVAGKVAPGDAEWRENVDGSRILVVDLPEPMLEWFGYGFIEDLSDAEALRGAAASAPGAGAARDVRRSN